MDKDVAIKDILQAIYSKKHELVLSEKSINLLNLVYKNTFKKEPTYIDFLYSNHKFVGLIGTLKNGRREIEKQFKKQKALQAGILTECNYAQTIASIFGLDKCLDLDATSFNNMPIACINFIQASSSTVSSARYLFYSTKCEDIFLVQYGNPSTIDATIIYYGVVVRLEFKENNAKAGEFDLGVDDCGKLYASDMIEQRFPLMQQYIEQFNTTTSLFEHLGTNYKINETCDFNPMCLVIDYFEQNNVDLIISSINNQLIAIKPCDLNIKFDDGSCVANINGSEIRTTGKNSSHLNLVDYFKNSIKEYLKINGNICRLEKVEKEGYGYVKERGGSDFSRYKLNYMFFVRKEFITEYDDYIEFSLDKVEQTKPTISIHINIVANPNHLKDKYLSE